MAGKYRDFDGQFAMMDVNFVLQDQRLDVLTDSQKWMYICLWCYAVQQRREALQLVNPTRTIARLSRQDPRTIASGLTKLRELCLIEWDDKNTITICGIKKKHPNLKWKDDGKSENIDPYKRPQKEKEKEKEKDKEKENIQKKNVIGTKNIKDFVDLYHRSLPFASKVASITKTRSAHIKARLREHPDPEFWKDLFQRISNSKFLRGEVPPVEGSKYRQFKLDIDFLLRESSIAKILEGKYDGAGTVKKKSFVDRLYDQEGT